jgi:hypothetical protein
MNPRFLNSGTTWRRVVCFTTWLLCPREKSPRIHWVGSRVDADDVDKRKFLTLQGLELRPLCRPASRYTDCAISAINGKINLHYYLKR